jgi:glycosyltransferase involved in cell wall biosynthesis
VIGMIARFHPMKNHALFLDVAARVARTFPRLVVVMAGTDIDERNRELLTAVESRGLRDRVRLVGEVPHTAPLLNLFDIACLTSSWGEGFPNILGEALLCAKPCVATDVGDAPVVVGESGAIVPVERADLFAESVCRLLEMSATERMNLGRTARERVIGCYGIDTVARRYSAKYESVLTRPPTTNLPLRKSGL